MSRPKVLIVGASIAGPTAAYWLAKAGAKVTVIERFPHLRSNGQNVDIRTVGVSVMRKMPGMVAAVRSKLMSMDQISFVGDDGKSFATIRPTGDPDQQSLISEYEIYRGDLARILYDMTKENENIRYIFGEQVAAIQQFGNGDGDGPVTVEFANGEPKSTFDLVVACDGANSRTRAIGLGCGVRDHVKSVNCWAAYCSTDKDLFNGSKVGQSYSAVGGRFIGMGPGRTGDFRVTAMGLHPRDGTDATKSFRDAVKLGDDAIKQFVADYFKGAGWRCDEIMEIFMKADDLYAHEFVQVKVPTLSKGRFVMVGDAGYAPGPTGTGTSLALAGAYLLAGEINKHQGDLAAGLRGYEDQMRPLLKEMTSIPGIFPAFLAPQSAWGLWVRNSILAFVSWTNIVGFAQKYLAAGFAKNEKDRLPVYDWVA